MPPTTILTFNATLAHQPQRGPAVAPALEGAGQVPTPQNGVGGTAEPLADKKLYAP